MSDLERDVERMQCEIDSLIAGASPRFGLRRADVLEATDNG